MKFPSAPMQLMCRVLGFADHGELGKIMAADGAIAKKFWPNLPRQALMWTVWPCNFRTKAQNRL